jgi:predicted transcriptional regulator
MNSELYQSRALAVFRNSLRVGAMREQEFDQILAARSRRSMERRKTLLLPRVDIRAPFKQHPNNLDIAARHSRVQRSHFEGIASLPIHIGARVQQILNQISVSEKGGQAQRIKTIRGVSVDRFRKLLDHRPHPLQVADCAGIEDIQHAAALRENGRNPRLPVVTGQRDQRNSLRRARAYQVRLFRNQFANPRSVALLNGRSNFREIHREITIITVYPITNRRIMISFFKPRTKPYELGALETKVMDILWSRGETSVRDAVTLLPRPLAYTTVMTTLDRLFKKGLLDRSKEDRAFFYTPRFSRTEWEAKRAGDLLTNMFSGKSSNDLLISCLVDAVGSQDAALLDQLEKKIRLKRIELNQVDQKSKRNP